MASETTTTKQSPLESMRGRVPNLGKRQNLRTAELRLDDRLHRGRVYGGWSPPAPAAAPLTSTA